jgi:hypothetical protein
MTNLATMRSRIDNELVRGGTMTTEINEAIRQAIDHYKYRRWWFNESTLTGATVIGQEYLSPPATFLSLDSLRMDNPSTGDDYPLKPADFARFEQWSENSGANDGKPLYFVEYKSQYRLYPIPDAVYTLIWAGLVDLGTPTADSDTSAWFTTAETLIRARAKAIVQIDHLRDERADQQMTLLAARGTDFMSLPEQAAYKSLWRENVRRTTNGRFAPSEG